MALINHVSMSITQLYLVSKLFFQAIIIHLYGLYMNCMFDSIHHSLIVLSRSRVPVDVVLLGAGEIAETYLRQHL